MKMIAKLSGLGALALGMAVGLVGCAENNDTLATKTPGGKAVQGYKPADMPKSSADAQKAMQSSNPMAGKDYPH